VRIRSGNQIFSKPPESEAFEGFPLSLDAINEEEKTDIIIQRQRIDEKVSGKDFTEFKRQFLK
jgi:hypothetical protein